MITGSVTTDLAATVRLRVRGSQGQQRGIRAIIDTGFDGWLTLPPALVADLGLEWRRRGRALLADGSEAIFDMTVQAVGGGSVTIEALSESRS